MVAGAALDHTRHAAGLAVQVETQREIVQVAQHLLGDQPLGIAADPLEGDVAQIVRQHPAEARAGISGHQCQRDLRLPLHAGRHAIDDALVGERHDQRDRLAEQHQHQSDHDARAQPRLARRPEIRQEAAHGRPAGDQLLVRRAGGVMCVVRHAPSMPSNRFAPQVVERAGVRKARVRPGGARSPTRRGAARPADPAGSARRAGLRDRRRSAPRRLRRGSP